MMGKKTRVNITIDDEILKTAKDLGLNVSKVSENALIKAIRALQGITDTNNPESSPLSSTQKEKWAGQDLNLRPPPRKGGVLTRLDDRPIT